MTHIIDKVTDLLDNSLLPYGENSRTQTDILNLIGDARIVLIGEATHGTKEFYEARAEITKHLIEKKGFMAVAIEGDWPDAYRVHKHVQSLSEVQTDRAALSEFKRFPAWMWRNTSVLDFVGWLREYNSPLPPINKVGFYGLDLYSLHSSMHSVITYLATKDPEAAKRAEERYECFDHLRLDPQQYGYLTTQGLKQPCVAEALAQVRDLRAQEVENTLKEKDEFFSALQNAQLVKDAENYYRAMFQDNISSWNIRDTHMIKTLKTLSAHLETKFKKPGKIVIWAHNSHVGDASATEMSSRGEISLGQLAREQFGKQNTFLIGFSTYQGTVTASDKWGNEEQSKLINPGLIGSYESLFHNLKYKNFILNLRDGSLEHYFQLPRLQRAIGVLYHPQTERYSHYYFTHLLDQFDLMIHFDKTSAVIPL